MTPHARNSGKRLEIEAVVWQDNVIHKRLAWVAVLVTGGLGSFQFAAHHFTSRS